MLIEICTFRGPSLKSTFGSGVPRNAGSGIGRIADEGAWHDRRCKVIASIRARQGLEKRVPSADDSWPGMAKREVEALLYVEHGDGYSTDWVEEES